MRMIALFLGVALCANAHLAAGTTNPSGVYFNELYISHTSTDDMEMIELIGIPGASLTGYVICVVEGDGNPAGTLDRAWDLTGLTMPADGYFVLGDTAEPNLDFDLGASNTIENGTDTFYVMFTANPAGITSLLSTDVDADEDLVTDLIGLGSVADIIAACDNDWHAPAGSALQFDRIYDGADLVGPNGAFLPGGIYRDGDYPGKWCTTYLDFDDVTNANMPRTPGSANVSGAIRTYGSPKCAGPGGYRMLLSLEGDTTSGTGLLDLDIQFAPPGSLAGLFISGVESNLPMSGGCPLLAGPPFVLTIIPMGGTLDGEGGLSLSGVAVPAGLTGFTLYMQAIADGGNGKFVDSNGLEIEFL